MAQTHFLLLLLGVKLLTQPSLTYWSCRPNGSTWMSDPILPDIASLLHLLAGWEVSVQLLFPRLLVGFPIQQSFLSKEQA